MELVNFEINLVNSHAYLRTYVRVYVCMYVRGIEISIMEEGGGGGGERGCRGIFP